MNPTIHQNRMQARGFLQVPWAAAIVALATGLLALGFALSRSGRAPEEKTQDLEEEIRAMQSKVSTVESELPTLHETGAPLSAELKSMRDENARAAERIAGRTAAVKLIEESNRQKSSQSQQKLDESRDTMRKEINQANTLLSQGAEEQQKRKAFERSMASFENAIVTIASGEGQLASGFLLSGFARPTIVTVKSVAQKGVPLVIKIRYRAQGEARDRVAAGRASVAFTDDASGLSFLTFEHTGRITLTEVRAGAMANAAVGEKAYAIGTQLLGDQILEFNVFDGAVSSTDRKSGTHELLQVAIPGNDGTRGAPIFNGEGLLIGVLLGPLEGLEKTSLAVPARELKGAIERFGAQR